MERNAALFLHLSISLTLWGAMTDTNIEAALNGASDMSHLITISRLVYG